EIPSRSMRSVSSPSRAYRPAEILPVPILSVKGGVSSQGGRNPTGAPAMPHVTPTPDDLRASVIDCFRKVATAPAGERKISFGSESAMRLGYDAAEIEALPASVTESFCSVGHPVSLRRPESGQIVLDLGCGAGLDSLLAAGRVDSRGKVIGIDMTPD